MAKTKGTSPDDPRPNFRAGKERTSLRMILYNDSADSMSHLQPRSLKVPESAPGLPRSGMTGCRSILAYGTRSPTRKIPLHSCRRDRTARGVTVICIAARNNFHISRPYVYTQRRRISSRSNPLTPIPNDNHNESNSRLFKSLSPSKRKSGPQAYHRPMAFWLRFMCWKRRGGGTPQERNRTCVGMGIFCDDSLSVQLGCRTWSLNVLPWPSGRPRIRFLRHMSKENTLFASVPTYSFS
jgi:hypothetical protein